MVLGLTAPAVEVFVKYASVALSQIGDDEAGVAPFLADFDAGDDALDAAPILRAVAEFLEATELAFTRRSLEPRLVLASRSATWRRNVEVGATPRM